jgi:hypothetical protein
MIKSLAFAGANVFRLNFSHGSHEVHQEVLDTIRKVNKEMNCHLGILQDLQGPKIRVGEVENNGVEIHPGEKLTITSDPVIGTASLVSTVYKNLPQDVQEGEHILIDDGNLELLVNDTDGKNVNCTVIHGGILKSRKGINLPNTKVSAPSLTEKDLEDLEFGLANDVDWIALRVNHLHLHLTIIHRNLHRETRRILAIRHVLSIDTVCRHTIHVLERVQKSGTLTLLTKPLLALLLRYTENLLLEVEDNCVVENFNVSCARSTLTCIRITSLHVGAQGIRSITSLIVGTRPHADRHLAGEAEIERLTIVLHVD